MSDRSRLCIHRFRQKIKVEYCNTKRFQSWSGLGKGWSDLNIFIHFLGCIFGGLADGSVTFNSVFMVLTKDRDFIDDVRKEWEEKKAAAYLPFVFSADSISYGGLTVLIQQVDCPNYGNRRADDLKCSFSKVNNFFKQNQRA